MAETFALTDGVSCDSASCTYRFATALSFENGNQGRYKQCR